MLTLEILLSISREELPEVARTIDSSELPSLVELLSEKDDKIRYQAFLLLQYRSQSLGDVYPFWETFCAKLKDANSYQRSIGIMMIAENAKWDMENKMSASLDDCEALLYDDKPITIRQSIQALGKVAEAKPDLSGKIASMLMSIDMTEIKETMRKSILLDILSVLVVIRKTHKDNKIDNYILDSLSGGILDKKSIRQIQTSL